LILLPRSSRENYPEKTGIRVQTERYCPVGPQRLGIRPRGHCGASVVTAAIAVINPKEDSVKLTDTQLVLLSAASQRDDRALERPTNLTGGAAGKVVAKLLAEGLSLHFGDRQVEA
jgi:hypothetical protein